MATNIEPVQIRDLKKGQKKQANYTSLNTQIHDYTNLKGIL